MIITSLTCLNIFHLKSFSKSFRRAPFRAYHHIEARLIPEVIAHRGGGAILPTAFNIKCLAIQYNKPSFKENGWKMTNVHRLISLNTPVACSSVSPKRVPFSEVLTTVHFVRITFCISVRFANRADHNFPICQAVCCVRIAKSGLLCDLFWWNNLPQNHRLSLDYKHIIRYSSNMCFCLGLTTNYSLKHNKHPLKPSLLSWEVFCLFSFTFLIRKRDTPARKLNRGQTGEGVRGVRGCICYFTNQRQNKHQNHQVRRLALLRGSL